MLTDHHRSGAAAAHEQWPQWLKMPAKAASMASAKALALSSLSKVTSVATSRVVTSPWTPAGPAWNDCQDLTDGHVHCGVD